jgi:hypothetical protein
MLAACGSDDRPPTVGVNFDTTVVSPREQATLSYAEQAITTACMRRHGFRVPAPRRESDATLPAKGQLLFGYESAQAMYRAIDGVRASSRPSHEARLDDRANDFYRSLPPERAAAAGLTLWGDEDNPRDIVRFEYPQGGTATANIGGCRGAALQRLYGDPARWTRAENIAGNAPLAVQQRVESSDDYKAAVRAWRACAVAKGLTARTEAAAVARAAKATSTDVRRIVRVTVTCHRESHIAAVVDRKSREVGGDVGRNIEGELLAYREGIRRALPIARRVLVDGAS